MIGTYMRFIASILVLTVIWSLAIVVAGQLGLNINGREIAFATQVDRDDVSQIILMDLDRDLKVSYPIIGRVWDLHWSPDGQRLAISKQESSTVYILDAGQLNESELLSGRTWGFRWSPDGESIAFRPAFSSPQLRIIKSDGSDEILIVENERDIGTPIWSPDGQWLAFTITPLANWSAALVHIETGETRAIATSEYPVHDIAWSPDSTHLAYTTLRDDRLGVMIQEVATGHEWPLLPTFPGDHRQPAWSPDGSHIALVANNRLHTVKADGTDMQELSVFTGFFFNLTWSPDGRSLSFSTGSGILSAFVIDDVNTRDASPRMLYRGISQSAHWRP